MPRKRCSFARKRSRSAPVDLRRSTNRNRQKRCKNWLEESMKAALEAVKEGQSISQAARDHGVPKTTLYDRVSGRVVHGSKPGPQPYLSRFLERQKDLSLRQGDTTAHVRMDAMNRETVEHYFSLLHDVLSTHDLLDKPAQIYNVDESGVPLNPSPPKVVSPIRYASSSESVLRHFSSVTPLQEIAVDSSPRKTESGTSKTPSTSSLSKFLIPPQASTPTGRKGEPPRARLLTSSADFEILKEKERRKQEEAEMKEKKKKEREEAKKGKEEEQRKKAEERAKKQELKAKVRAGKEAKKGKGKQPAGVGTKRS